MPKRSLIVSTLALAISGGILSSAQADEPQLNQDQLQQQIRDRAMRQHDPSANSQQQMRQNQHQYTHQNRNETRFGNPQGGRPSYKGQGGFGGMGGSKGDGGRGGL